MSVRAEIAREEVSRMDIMDRAIDRQNPKVAPLAQSMLSAAIEQGATVRDFDLASQRILEKAKECFLRSRLADFVSEI